MTNYGKTKVSVTDRTIKINGYISLSTVSAVARAICNMQRHNLDPIVVIIGNSHGGCASSGQMIFGMLRNTAASVYTVVEQFAWSAAFYIFLAGEKRILFRNARVGPHSVTITHYKDVSHDFVEQYRNIMYTQKFNEKNFAVIQSVTKISYDNVKTMCLTKKIFSAREALRAGIATNLASAKNFYKPRSHRTRHKANAKR